MKYVFNDNDYCLPSNGSEHNENIVIDLPLLKILLYIGSRYLVSLVGPVAKADALFNAKVSLAQCINGVHFFNFILI